MARPGAFKSEKRKKELNRLKKQEEKRQKRLKKDTPGQPDITDENAEAGTETATGEVEKE